MNQPTANFLKICQTAGIEEKQSHRLWLEIWNKIISQFLSWIIKESSLNKDQRVKFTSTLEKIKADGPGETNVIDWVFPILSEEQKTGASRFFAEAVLEGFNEFYGNLFSSLSPKQGEAVNKILVRV